MQDEITESNNVEFKSASGGRLQKDLWHTISAFSNSDGGKIYFGIAPNSTKIGLTGSEIDKLQADLAQLCKTAFSVRITPEIRLVGDYVVAVFEPVPAHSRPVFFKKIGLEKGTFIRVGSSNLQADSEIIKRLIAAAQGGVETNEYDYSYKDVLSIKAINDYIALLNKRNDNVYQRFSVEEILRKQKIISRDGKKITLFGLLAFSGNRDLQDIIAPTTNIAVTLYPGETKVRPGDTSKTYEDNKEFNGSVLSQYYAAFNYIKSRIPTKGIVVDGSRQDIISIPEIAIREALANAIVHRDYSTTASRIQVDIYSNRIEFINPGNSLVPIAELDSAPSTSRNPLLMNFLKEYGVTDQKGRGIRTIKESVKESNLVEPGFSDTGRSFKATLFSQNILTADDLRFIESLPYEMNSRQKNAIAYALRNREAGVTNGIYREINNMTAVRDDKKANVELKELVEKDILLAIGTGKGRRYKIK